MFMTEVIFEIMRFNECVCVCEIANSCSHFQPTFNIDAFVSSDAIGLNHQ